MSDNRTKFPPEEIRRKRDKSRLNITVDRGILEEARESGINISAAIERTLAYFIDLNKKDRELEDKLDRIRDMYNETFQGIRRLLELHEIEEIEIGELIDTEHSRKLLEEDADSYSRENVFFPLTKALLGSKIILRPNMLLYLKNGKYYVHRDTAERHPTEGDTAVLPIRNYHLKFLHRPELIYKDLLNRIIERQQHDEDKAKRLRLGLKIIDAVLKDNDNDTLDSSESGIEPPSFRRILETSDVKAIRDPNSFQAAATAGAELAPA